VLFTHLQTLDPPLYLLQHSIASRMATQRDFEHNQIFLKACVLLDDLRLMTVLIVTYYSSPSPPASPSVGRGCVNTFFYVVIFVKNNLQTAFISLREDYANNALR
jgi:hypothetical protein